MKIEKLQLNATLARILLSISLVLLLGAMSAGFYFAYGFMKQTAESVGTVQAEARATDAKLQNVLSLESKLEKHKDSVKKAEQIVAESTSYQYQNQVINDLSAYAQRAGVGISGFNFEDTATTAKSGTGGSAAAKPSPSGAKVTSVSIQMSKNLDYVKFLHFLHLLEQNLTRMQVANISLTKGESAGSVESQTLKLELYLR